MAKTQDLDKNNNKAGVNAQKGSVATTVVGGKKSVAKHDVKKGQSQKNEPVGR
jgi:hypothetical protein